MTDEHDRDDDIKSPQLSSAVGWGGLSPPPTSPKMPPSGPERLDNVSREMRPFEQPPAADEALRDAEGLIVAVGAPGAGKSTLGMFMRQAWLTDTRYNRRDAAPVHNDPTSALVRKTFIKNWDLAVANRCFPAPTDETGPAAVDFAYSIWRRATADAKEGARVTLRVLEVAGETFAHVAGVRADVDNGQEPSQVRELRTYMQSMNTEASARKIILLVVNGAESRQDRIMEAQAILVYIYSLVLKNFEDAQERGQRARRSAEVFVVVANPQACNKRFHGEENNATLTLERARSFLQQMYPVLFARLEQLDDWKAFGFSVGRVDGSKGSADTDVISAPSYDDTRKIVDAIYVAAAGEPLRRNFIERWITQLKGNR